MSDAGAAGMRIIFGDHALDIDRRELSLRGEPVSVAPQVFDLLVYLVRNRDRVVSKDDLIEAVWGGRIVSESALTTRINAVRRAIGDTGAKQSLIRTVARRGIRFVGKVHNEDEPLRADRTGEPAPQLGPLGPPEKASIAVLPFANLSGDPGQEYFVDGMVEEIITALSRIQWLLVIARNSSFTYKGQIVNVKQVGHELGVRYVLEGSVRKVGQRLRITAQLIDAINGAHLWADRFDGSLDDIFDIQDKVATNVAGVIEPTLQTAEMVRSVNRPTNDLTAYDFYLRGYATYVSAARQNADALRLFEQAITRDPRYGPALAWAGVCCARLLLDGRSEDAARDRLKGTDFARRSLEVAGDDPTILANAPYALAYFGEDIGAMLAFVSRSLSLNPSFARGWHISGVLRLYAGQLDAAIEHSEASLRLSPRARVGWTVLTIGAAHFYARRFEEAVPKLLLSLQEDPSLPNPYRYLAACYAHMGRLDEARQVLQGVQRITKVVVPDLTYLRNSEHRELYRSGLRLAMRELK